MAASAAISGKAQAMPAAKPAPLDRRRTFAFFCMVFGMFMAILDIQIVSASLAEIQAGLSASSDEISWVQTSYLIAEVIMIPLSGTLSRVLSTRWMFVISAGGFTLHELHVRDGDARSTQMIVYRALQGFIGGGMIPTVFASAFTIFPPEKRPVISPIIGLVATLAPTIGPTLGGYLTDLFSWHWLFLVNIVPGIFVTVLDLSAGRFRRAGFQPVQVLRLGGLAASWRRSSAASNTCSRRGPRTIGFRTRRC